MGKSLLGVALGTTTEAEWVGSRGEKLTARKLKFLWFSGIRGKVLRNVYIPTEDGGTTEIDVVFITRKGIFVIESKNYSGWIFGNEKDQYWTAMLPNKQKNKFYNPIKQNNTHIKWLEKYLVDSIPLFSLIVFSKRCELKQITVANKDIHVIKRDKLQKAVKQIWRKTEDAIDEQKVESVYEILSKLTNVDIDIKNKHIENINDKFNKNNAKSIKSTVDNKENIELIKEIDNGAENKMESLECDESDKVIDENLICPTCGGELKLRIARKGANAGNSFYGCSNYPKCKYIKNK